MLSILYDAIVSWPVGFNKSLRGEFRSISFLRVFVAHPFDILLGNIIRLLREIC